jgi:hypothetical protein
MAESHFATLAGDLKGILNEFPGLQVSWVRNKGTVTRPELPKTLREASWSQLIART